MTNREWQRLADTAFLAGVGWNLGKLILGKEFRYSDSVILLAGASFWAWPGIAPGLFRVSG